MQSLIAVFLGLVLMVTAPWGSTAGDLKPFDSDIRRILDAKKLRVAVVNIDYPPLFEITQTGSLSGTDVELAREVARELGVEAEFIRTARSFDEVADVVARGEADIGISTTITLARAKKVMFSNPYLVLNMALLLNRLKLTGEGITSQLRELEDLRRTTEKIGLLRGSAYKDYARKMFPNAQLEEYPSLRELIAAAENGELLAAVRNDLTAKLYLHRHPASALRLQLFVDKTTKDYVAFSVRADSPHLLSWLNYYILLNEITHDSDTLIEKHDLLGSHN